MSSTDATQQPTQQPTIEDEQKKAKRVQMIDILDIYVPPPRVRNHFTKKLSDVEKHFELKQLKKKEESPASDAASSEDGSQEIRLSPEANAALAVVASSLLVDVTKHAMNNALSANMKRVTVAHFLSRKLEGLDSQCLVGHLPVVRQRLAQADQPAQPAAQVPAQAEPTAEQPAAEQSTESVDPKKDPEFTTYVARAFNDVKTKDQRYADLMLTHDFKTFLSSVLVEFVQCVASSSMVFIEAMDLKTVKHKAVMQAVKNMFVMHGKYDVFQTYKTTVEEKLRLFESYEEERKTAAPAEQASTPVPAEQPTATPAPAASG